MISENKIKSISRFILVLAAVLLATNIFLPIWKIELWAPQYPEGLSLLIYADKLAGDVDIINGLNHYIGMQTLHTENFIEFSILRYILGFFVLLILSAAFIGNKKVLYILFVTFVLFSLLAMVDFYRWNYNYGHDLDPKAAIKVPGMAYQPPLIGYKKLLNFGAYSIPAIGGILFIASVALVFFTVLLEKKVFAKWFKRKQQPVVAIILCGFIFLNSCGMPGPRPIKLNSDECAFCKMSLTNAQYVAQLTTDKGRQYVFDDVKCMVDYTESDTTKNYAHFYIADYCDPSAFIDPAHAILLYSDQFQSPMGGNIATFSNPDSAQFYKLKLRATEISWINLIRH